MGQEHSLPNGDRDPLDEYTEGLMRKVREARAAAGKPIHTPKLCRSCEALIYWGTVASTGKSMPVDAEPVEGGNVQLYDRAGKIMVKIYDSAPPGTKLRMPHFATCPQADQWRR